LAVRRKLTFVAAAEAGIHDRQAAWDPQAAGMAVVVSTNGCV
jgi:hypothetical protein